jgi:hypothetical protein
METFHNVQQEYAQGRVRARFGVVADAGYQPLPDILLLNQKKLGLRSEDLNVLLNLLLHWYEPERMPYPSTVTIAKRMGGSPRTIQRTLVSLRKRGFIAKEPRSNYHGVRPYDVTPLVRMLEPLARERIALRKGGRSLEESE